ncbi:MAG: hypothetical protein ACJ8EY_07950 [Sphingomicrobium sp.]
MALFFAAATFAAWQLPWGWLRWPLVGIGLFLTGAALLVVYSMVEGPRGEMPD